MPAERSVMKRRLVCGFLVSFILSVLCGCGGKGLVISGTSAAETVSDSDASADAGAETDEDCIYVYVTGAVVNPGVYAMQEGDRIFDVVEKAGGFTEDALQTEVNLAQILEDEDQIHIPTAQEAEEQAAADEAAGLVNINTATLEELCTLTGIGEAKAQSIISYREENGNFSSIEEIMNISGIKEGVYEKIKDQITV